MKKNMKGGIEGIIATIIMVGLVVALIIGVIILRRSDIINVNTVITFITIGPLISFFSKIINKYIYKNETTTFN